MPLDPSLILQGAAPLQQQPNMLAQYAQVQQVQQNRLAMHAQQQAMMLGAVKQKAAELDLSQQQLAATQQSQISQLLAQNKGDVGATIAQARAAGNPLADTLEKNKNAADELIAKQRQAAASAQKDEVETNLKKVSQAADALGTLKDTSDELKPIYYQTLRQQAIAAKMPGAEQLPLTWNPQAAQMVDALHGQALTAKDRIEAGLKKQAEAEAARHNTTEEQLTAARDYNSNQNEALNRQSLNQYRGAELGIRSKQLGLEGARLGLEKKRLSEETAGMSLTPEAMQNAVDQYAATGQMPQLGMGKASASLRAQIMNSAAQKYGQMDLAQAKVDYSAKQQATKAFGTGTQGQQITALNTSIGHLQDALEAADAMGNGKFKAGNQIYNTIRSQFGSDAVTNFDQFKHAVAGEVTKTLNGRVTEGELQEISQSISNASSPQQLRTALTNQAKIMGSKLNALQDTGSRLGVKGTEKFVSGRSKEALQGMGLDPNTMRPATSSGKRPSLDSIFGGMK